MYSTFEHTRGAPRQIYGQIASHYLMFFDSEKWLVLLLYSSNYVPGMYALLIIRIAREQAWIASG